MTIEEVKEKINTFLIDELEIEPSKVQPSSRLKEDVGIDSLDYVDIVAFVTRNFGFKIDKAEMKDVLTLQQFYEFVSNRA